MDVVQSEQHRPLLGEVGDEPVETMQDREAAVRRRVAVMSGGRKRRERQARRAREQGFELAVGQARQLALEEQSDGAVGEVALKRAATRSEHAHAGLGCAHARFLEQAALADPGRTLEHDDRPRARRRAGDGGLDQRELIVALDDHLISHSARVWTPRRNYQAPPDSGDSSVARLSVQRNSRISEISARCWSDASFLIQTR